MKYPPLFFTFLVVLAAAPVWAQGGSAFLETAPANRLSPRLPGLTARHLSYKAAGPDCPRNVIALDFHYPQGLGPLEVDQAVAGHIRAEFDERRSGGDRLFCDRELCEAASCGLWPMEKIFSVFTSSPRYVSILFTESSYTGGAHDNLDFEVLHFDLRTGRPLTLGDFFPQPETAEPQYWRRVYAGWCRAWGTKFPLHFQGVEPCRPEEAPQELPADIPPAASLEDLGRLIFTPQGATLLLGPYESGTYASGAQALDLPREELLAIGANPGLWAE